MVYCRLLLLVSAWLLLAAEEIVAQGSVSASATVRAEVREICPDKSKKKECKPKPPKALSDDEDAAAAQSILESAAAISPDGGSVQPSLVTVWLAAPNALPIMLESGSGPMSQEEVETELGRPVTIYRLPPIHNAGNRVITIVAEY